MAKVTFKDKGLKNLTKALGDVPKAKVGVLQAKNSRQDGETNASIGIRHEFGIGVPKRSFLRAPLIANLAGDLQAQRIDQAAVDEAVKSGTLEELVRKIGLVGEQTVRNAFMTEGDGKWPAHAPGYTNNTGMILSDTTQLRDSISSEVIK